MRDTTRVAEELRLEAIRRMAPTERLRQVLAFSESMRRLALAALRTRHPERTDLELLEILSGGPFGVVTGRRRP